MTVEEIQAERDRAIAIDNARHANNMEVETMRIKLESVRLAKETLIENSRNKPIDSREVSANDIKNFADTLVNYVKG